LKRIVLLRVLKKPSSFRTSFHTFWGFGHVEVVEFELRVGLKQIVLFTHFRKNQLPNFAEITCRKYRNVDFFYMQVLTKRAKVVTPNGH
jgi:hypothetical protein